MPASAPQNASQIKDVHDRTSSCGQVAHSESWYKKVRKFQRSRSQVDAKKEHSGEISMLLIAENANLAHDVSHARALLKLDPMEMMACLSN